MSHPKALFASVQLDSDALFAKRIARELWRPVWIFLACFAAVIVYREWFEIGKDSTDPPDGRSGLRLFIDAETGVEYLGSPSGGLIERVKPND